MSMKVNFENYRGIKFVRISSLPEDQKSVIWNSISSQNVIKILRGQELLNDCIRYEDYQEWYFRFKARPATELPKSPARLKNLKLQFK